MVFINIRITHASPAGAYAHVILIFSNKFIRFNQHIILFIYQVLNRHWETFDGEAFNETFKRDGCQDIASQLIDNNSFINV